VCSAFFPAYRRKLGGEKPEKNDDVPRGSPESLRVFLRKAGTWTTQNRVQPPGCLSGTVILLCWRDSESRRWWWRARARDPRAPKSPRLLATRKRPQGFRQIGKSWSGLERHAKPLLGVGSAFLAPPSQQQPSWQWGEAAQRWEMDGKRWLSLRDCKPVPLRRGLHALPWPCLGLRILPAHTGMRRRREQSETGGGDSFAV
jgi:hypothetical protein